MRLRLIRRLDGTLPPAAEDPFVRAVSPSDAAGLGTLMLGAYRGTIDDAGEGPAEAAAEIERLLAGAYGPFDHAASELVERDGMIANATLVTVYEGLPLVAFSMTGPAWKRRGLARAGLVRVMHRLRGAGAEVVRLAVTDGNAPAQRLYESLGFVRG